MNKPPESFFDLDDFVPGLRQAFEHPRFDPSRLLRAAVPVKDPEQKPLVPAGSPRTSMKFTDGKSAWSWETDSLRALFRGDKQPPHLGDYPNAYTKSFTLLDLHVLEISQFFGDRKDAEMLEIYSVLRRRPDGKSLGFVHDYMWQAAALILGTQPLSQAEFEAILARLERSCRTFDMGHGSHNYVDTLRTTLGR